MGRWIFAAAAMLALTLAMPAHAQRQQPTDVDCARIIRQLDDPPTRDQLDSLKLCREITNLQEENTELRRNNNALSAPLAFLLPWSGLITGLVGLFVAITAPLLGWWINRGVGNREKLRLEQERQLKRESHNLELMRNLGSKEISVQLTSASALLRRYEDIQVLLGEKDISKTEAVALKTEARLIKDAIFAALCQPDGNPDFCKYAADRMVASFGMLLRTDQGKVTKTRPGNAKDAPKSAMAEYGLQRAKLGHVFWRFVHGAGVDFYAATLTSAGLRDAWLTNAIFRRANLEKAVLINADLRGANFSKANLASADLRGADISGAIFTDATGLDTALFSASTRFSDDTRWPDARRPGAGYALTEEAENG